MKFYQKIFLCMFLVLALGLSLAGYILISSTFSSSLERERNHGLEEYQLAKFSLQSGILNQSRNSGMTPEKWEAVIRQTQNIISDGAEIYLDNLTDEFSFSFERISAEALGSRIQYTMVTAAEHWMVYEGIVEQGEEVFYFSIARNAEHIFDDRDQQVRSYMVTFVLVLLLGGILMYLVCLWLTRPVRRLSDASKRITRGNYEERVRYRGTDEIAQLTEHFNQMAGTIQEKIKELEEHIRRQEEFTAGFAHELKTPLTSMVGYADMIYRKDMEREKVKMAADSIINEGLRLESLSRKMMDLIVLGRKDFILEDIFIPDFIRDIQETMQPQQKAEGLEIRVAMEEAYVCMEYDLMKTLFLNLLDNCIKAEAKVIHISGQVSQQYEITVKDDGKGMAEEELRRITEAFYMVDRSRTRQNSKLRHSAGLGLAIAEKIAQLHDTHLNYQSRLGHGTEVAFRLTLSAEEVSGDEE